MLPVKDLVAFMLSYKMDFSSSWVLTNPVTFIVIVLISTFNVHPWSTFGFDKTRLTHTKTEIHFIA